MILFQGMANRPAPSSQLLAWFELNRTGPAARDLLTTFTQDVPSRYVWNGQARSGPGGRSDRSVGSSRSTGHILVMMCALTFGLSVDTVGLYFLNVCEPHNRTHGQLCELPSIIHFLKTNRIHFRSAMISMYLKYYVDHVIQLRQ